MQEENTPRPGLRRRAGASHEDTRREATVRTVAQERVRCAYEICVKEKLCGDEEETKQHPDLEGHKTGVRHNSDRTVQGQSSDP
jgi:hypothetical protein